VYEFGAGLHEPASPDDEPVFVRAIGRLDDERATLVYLLGPEPDPSATRRVWAYQDRGVPWTCARCGQPIDVPRGHPRTRHFLLKLPPHFQQMNDADQRDAIRAMANEAWRQLTGRDD
jgi:hypothetical protein